jgi:hypothetical protein
MSGILLLGACILQGRGEEFGVLDLSVPFTLLWEALLPKAGSCAPPVPSLGNQTVGKDVTRSENTGADCPPRTLLPRSFCHLALSLASPSSMHTRVDPQHTSHPSQLAFLSSRT